MYLTRISIVVVVFFFSFAQPSNAQTPEVRKVKAGKVQFSVRFPQKSQQVGGAGKDPVKVQHQFMAGSSTGVLMLAYQDYSNLNFKDPKTGQRAMKLAIDGFRRAVGGEIKSQKKINMKRKDVTAVELRMTIPARSGATTSHMYLVGKRWYHVFAMGTPDFVKSKRTQDYLKSVTIVDAKASEQTDRPTK